MSLSSRETVIAAGDAQICPFLGAVCENGGVRVAAGIAACAAVGPRQSRADFNHALVRLDGHHLGRNDEHDGADDADDNDRYDRQQYWIQNQSPPPFLTEQVFDNAR
jgi:hypothetical protein